MLDSLKRTMKEPEGVIGALWPMILVVPYLPGLPRPSLGGLSWRQEIVFAGLLTVTLALLIARSKKGSQNLTVGLHTFPTFLVSSAGLFTLWAAASVSWASNSYAAAHYAFTWGAYLLFFILMRLVASHPRFLRASFFSLGGVVWLLTISCLVEWLAGAPLTDHAFRMGVKPLFRGFSGFSEVLAVACPIFFALALALRNSRRAILCGITGLLAWFCILVTLERAPILGAAGGLVVLTLGTFAISRCRPRSLIRAGLLATAIVLTTALHLVPSQFRSRDSVPGVTVLERFQNTSTSDPNTSVRLLFWGVGLEIFRAYPLIGVGANNYEVAFPWARAQFSKAHRDSPLIAMNEHLLTQYAHNEYVQILAELGAVGFSLFLTFCVVLVLTLWQALRKARRPLLALGAGGGLFAFALSSGASAFSFRWMGSGLIFFFAAAVVSHLASDREDRSPVAIRPWPRFAPLPMTGALVFAVVMFVGASAQATNSLMHACAQSVQSPARSEQYYRVALTFNPFDAATHYDFGSLLYRLRRLGEAVPHLRYAVEHGINTSINYALLASAEEEAGDPGAAEQTLGYATQVYPSSIFLLVRHAVALARNGLSTQSEMVFANALSLDSRAAKGWQQLIDNDIDAAYVAAKQDRDIALPGELIPQAAVFQVLQENEQRFPENVSTGWRARMRSQESPTISQQP